MKIPFQQVDAFADRPFTGNPAAVMPLEAWLDDATLQAIAAENNLAETAFIVGWAGPEADFELRWFTPEVEVALCGHATLATGHVLLSRNPAVERVRFMTRQSGPLEVARDGEGYRLALPAWQMTPKPLPDHVAALGGSPVETLWRDGGYALFRFATAAEVIALEPDFRAMRSFGDTLFIATAPGSDTDIVSRAFAPGAGIDEDPVTGSAHCLLATYWAKQLGRDAFTAHQASKRGGYLDVTLAGDRVILGGRCVTVIEGVFTLS
ncbi:MULTISPECIES: PhzF family phenazine biosynthesis protein [unclassified Sphingomonas]|uniref:PhzF family phenazine biosynthesis protein n=1 Tax=unclassified Sphingomonas TaxID=196159 RepID=UPI0006F418B7|nr:MULTISPECIES: PhzF family phenazine biosynthesis protein [unclassified Sphingomonas]KQX19419.1 PhzF family phenazine biosynthesis protein [Sphingomonas sp. Root1294]KQY65620.1 PhzF family phenazine biosynthesis protein [Sphingomonas sp. Root50]KRB95077.1 PhzF family phenazine biosynthesis protein [Sphingomonas sp. Root720]